MGDEFYCVLKLVSGEEIFSLICVDDNNDDPVIILHNPIIMKIIHNQKGMFIKIKPWLEIPNDDMFIIKMDKVITITEIKDKNIISFYEKYLNDGIEVEFNHQNNIDQNQVKITDNMGFISTVEDARKKLEKIFKGLKES